MKKSSFCIRKTYWGRVWFVEKSVRSNGRKFEALMMDGIFSPISMAEAARAAYTDENLELKCGKLLTIGISANRD